MKPDEAWLDLSEVTDRTSPPEHPDMCLITSEELADYMHSAFQDGLIQAAWTLRNAANTHEAEAAVGRKVAENEGNAFAARILRSYANGLIMDAEKVRP
jgi:hypothetical protein